MSFLPFHFVLSFVCFALVCGVEMKEKNSSRRNYNLSLTSLRKSVFDLSTSRESCLNPHCLCMCMCVYKLREGDVARVLSDPERVNTKLISLFQGILQWRLRQSCLTGTVGVQWCAQSHLYSRMFSVWLLSQHWIDIVPPQMGTIYTNLGVHSDTHSYISWQFLFVWTIEPSCT